MSSRFSAKAVTFQVSGLAALAAVFLPALSKPKVFINRGSCLQACSAAIDAVKEHVGRSNSLPYDPRGSAQALAILGLPDEVIALVRYANDESLKPGSPPGTILLTCVNSSPLKDGKSGRYVALLSGEILVVPETNAVLGGICPLGVGNPVRK
jgi:hypothetical protein